MESNPVPTGGGAILGLLGLLLAFIGGLISVVIVLEYDPEARGFLDHGVPVEGKVLEVQRYENPEPLPWEPPVGILLTVQYLLEGQTYKAKSRPVFGSQAEYLKQGSEIYAYVKTSEPDYILLRNAMPHAPRDLNDILAPAIFWILGAICLIFGPELLYAGTTEAPQDSLKLDKARRKIG